MKDKFTVIFFGLIFIFVISYEFLWSGLSARQKESTKREWVKVFNG